VRLALKAGSVDTRGDAGTDEANSGQSWQLLPMIAISFCNLTSGYGLISAWGGR
jgi:hypothetical protein